LASLNLRDRFLYSTETVGSRLSRPQLEALEAYVSLLLRWNRVYNLAGVRDAAGVVMHLLDCLAVIAPLQRQMGSRPFRLLDAGSGAGLPGVVIATVLPHCFVLCAEAVAKKAAFINEVKAQMGLENLKVSATRVESDQDEDFDAVVSRAFASLVDFVRLTKPRLRGCGVWMAMKGRVPRGEINEVVRLPVEVFHVEQLSIPLLAAERSLVWMRPSVSKTRLHWPIPANYVI